MPSRSSDTNLEQTQPSDNSRPPKGESTGTIVQAGAEVADATNPPVLERLVGNRYLVRSLHARGGMGQICIAQDEELHRRVAFKEIQPRFALQGDVQARFIREAEVTGRLEHPGIVPVYSLGRDSTGVPYYAMRFIEGRSLRKAISDFHDSDTAERDPTERSLTFRQLLARFGDVCNAIAYAHDRGYLHRDIKPDNIMLGDFGETLVVDWGLAKQIDNPNPTDSVIRDLPDAFLAEMESFASPEAEGGTFPSQNEPVFTQMGRIIGTPGFMSPEQAGGRWDIVGIASDIWSLGATLYAILTGSPPYVGESREVIRRTERGDPIPMPRQMKASVPVDLEHVCMKAMARLPEERYTSALELRGDIERWFASEEEKRVALAGQEIANQQREIALRTLRSMIFELDAELRNLPGMLELRKRLLKNALDGLKELVHSAEAAGQADREQIRVLLALGEIFATRAGTEQALDLYLKAQSIAEERATRDPRQVTARQDLATSLARLGEIRMKMGDTSLALSAFHRALVIRQAVEHELPTDFRARVHLAVSLNLLGDAQRRMGAVDVAEVWLNRALGIFRELMEADPQNARLMRHLATACDNLGRTQLRLGRLIPALQTTTDFLDLTSRLIQLEPGSARFRREQSIAFINLGLVQMKLGDIQSAQQSIEQANLIRQQLMLDDPENTQARRDLSVAMNVLAQVQLQLNAPQSALESVGLALELVEPLALEDSRNARLQRDVAITHQIRGEIRLHRDEPDQAEEDFLQARQIFESLRNLDPENAWAYAEYMTILIHLGDAQAHRDSLSGALYWYELALQAGREFPRPNLLQPEMEMIEDRLQKLRSRHSGF